MKNAQLWKRILNNGLWSGSTAAGVSNDEIESRIIRSTIISSAVSPDSHKLPKWKDFTRIAMPFESFWIEGVAQYQNTDDDTPKTAITFWGCLVFPQPEASDRRWVFLTVMSEDGIPPVLTGCMMIQFDEAGNVVASEDGLENSRVVLSSRFKGDDRHMPRVFQPVAYALESLMLLGCKNVNLSPRVHDDAAQAKRAAKRFGGNPDDYRYHVLVVRPPGAKSDSPSQEIGVMPWHRCRGHYVHYGRASVHGHSDGMDRGLLFGTMEGRYYCPPMVKGDKKNGTVEKDYQIGNSSPLEVA